MLDIDRQRQRISLGLKQTQEDPWQRVVDTYNIGDELEGTVTKVVTFGAFVEILDGVEGLVHISELAQHHVENPREIIQPGDPVRVKILEIDSERRRLSLSIKRVEGQVLPVRPIVPPTERCGRPRRHARARAVRGRVRRAARRLRPADRRHRATTEARVPEAAAEPDAAGSEAAGRPRLPPPEAAVRPRPRLQPEAEAPRRARPEAAERRADAEAERRGATPRPSPTRDSSRRPASPQRSA